MRTLNQVLAEKQIAATNEMGTKIMIAIIVVGIIIGLAIYFRKRKEDK